MALGVGPPKESLRGGTAGENGEESAGVQLSPSSGTLRLWAEVATGIDKTQTVVWKKAADSLRAALDHLTSSENARSFADKYMKPVISILLKQQPSKIGQMEKGCVEESLRLGVMIVATDLKAKADTAAGNCELLEVLSMVFNKERIYYRGSKSSGNTHASGLPEVRMWMINKFRNTKGFSALATYLSARVSTPNFPPLEQLHYILHATAEAIPLNFSKELATIAKVHMWEEDAIRVAKAVMDTTGSATEEALKRQTHEGLNQTLTDLHVIFSRLASSRRKELYSFFRFWRGIVLKLITSQSLPLKLFGWEQMNAVIYESRAMRPPPRTFVVSGAGCGFVNGRYNYASPITDEGYAKPGCEISYQLQIPDSVPEKEGGGKKLTLFRCTMRSQEEWWFLSEADEEEPGTDKDIDYYQHKCNKKEEATPPRSGWVTCRSAGVEPPPTLEPSGIVVPRGEEFNTLEHQLAKWALENHLIELVLGDSIRPEIVTRSKELIEFLASMCTLDNPLEADAKVTADSGMVANRYCLKPSHLLLAWKTCTSKADAAVSKDVYKLLVEILPSLPNDLAITLLKEIQKSLADCTDKRDYLFEVAEFCGALAVEKNRNSNDAWLPVISDEVGVDEEEGANVVPAGEDNEVNGQGADAAAAAEGEGNDPLEDRDGEENNEEIEQEEAGDDEGREDAAIDPDADASRANSDNAAFAERGEDARDNNSAAALAAPANDEAPTAASPLRLWLRGLEVQGVAAGRFERYAPAFEHHFASLSDLALVCEEEEDTWEALFQACHVSRLGDKLRIKRAVWNLPQPE